MLRATQDTATNRILTCTGLSPSMAWLSRQVPVHILLRYRSPTTPLNAETLVVWALPRSLATTSGITIVFSSYGYLDVSVPRVRP